MTPPLFPSACLPDPTITQLDALTVSADHQTCTLHLRTTAPTSVCPQCHQPSSRIHSRYARHVRDLPLATVGVTIALQARRFVCRHAPCPQRIFTERLPTMVAPRLQRTHRLVDRHTTIGFALGGRAGARLAQDAGIPISRGQLLNDVRAYPLPEPPEPQIISVDDWALAKGQIYGTIILDLETHQPLDLLPDRCAETLAAWLTAHPSIIHISRDRASAYADGARQGAPDAIQSADRWHLLQNLRDAVATILIHYDAVIRQPIPAAVDPPPAVEPGSAPADSAVAPPPVAPKPTPRQRQRLEQHTTIHALHAQGWQQQTIAAHLGVHPKTVSRHLRLPADHLPTRAPRRHSLDPWIPQVLARWEAGCTNALQIAREVRAAGFPGSVATVRAFVATLRTVAGAPAVHATAVARQQGITPPSRTTLASWLLLPAPSLTATQQPILTHLTTEIPALLPVVTLTQAGALLIRSGSDAPLTTWLDQLDQSGIAAFRSLASGIRQDEAAVRAALTLPWSQGPIEGTINRLKLLKRQMYGRAKLDLLRQRLLRRPAP